MGGIGEFTAEDVVRAIDENRVEVCRAWGAWEGIAFNEDPEMLWTMSDVPYPLFNAVLRSRIPAAKVDDRVESLITEAKKRGVPLAWFLSPLTEPRDLSARLSVHGFSPGATAVGMAADLAEMPESVVIPERLMFEEVSDDEGLRDWCYIISTVYNFPEFVKGPWYDVHAAMGVGPDKPWRHLIATLGGRTRGVAAASLFNFNGTAFVANVATLPGMRGLGIGTAITMKALWDARDRGARLATLCSTKMAVDMYRRLGFKEYCRMWFYTWGVPLKPGAWAGPGGERPFLV